MYPATQTPDLQAIQLINTLTQELDIHAAMESVRHVALELLECERVTLFLIIESRQELRWVSIMSWPARQASMASSFGVWLHAAISPALSSTEAVSAAQQRGVEPALGEAHL
jgi:GAF domain-containing protein